MSTDSMEFFLLSLFILTSEFENMCPIGYAKQQSDMILLKKIIFSKVVDTLYIRHEILVYALYC